MDNYVTYDGLFQFVMAVTAITAFFVSLKHYNDTKK